MNPVYEGDNWKHVKEPKRDALSRPAAQQQLDTRYALGMIDLETWRAEFDKLSEPSNACYGPA